MILLSALRKGGGLPSRRSFSAVYPVCLRHFSALPYQASGDYNLRHGLPQYFPIGLALTEHT